MRREDLTREEAIRRHRTMWNWLADQAEKNGELYCKISAVAALWPDEDWGPCAFCWACEIHGGVCEDGKGCVLVWPNGRCASTRNKEGEGYLYTDWHYAEAMGDVGEYVRLARIIANLPEREVMETCGND